MISLNFPVYNFSIKSGQKNNLIFDPIRKKYVVLTPEEWVRQHVINYLVSDKNVPKALISVEQQFESNTITFRADIVVYNRLMNAVLLVECKAPEVEISQTVFNQVSRYNLNFKVSYLFVTNGLKHFCAKINFSEQKAIFLPDLPNFEELK